MHIFLMKSISAVLSEKLNRAWEKKRRQERLEEAKRAEEESFAFDNPTTVPSEESDQPKTLYLKWDKSDKIWTKLLYKVRRTVGFLIDYDAMKKDADLIIEVLPGFELNVIKNTHGHVGKMSVDCLNISLPEPVNEILNQ